jgi:3'-phosphoadenosine 5'-phosphosulfate sulfotransferase (PAPS reductase)/FAD synthetase
MGLTLFELIEQEKMLPNFRSRFCTRMLKIEPTIEYFASLPKGSVLYVGLRADEPDREGLYGDDVDVRFPMREWGWTEEDVWFYLADRGVDIPRRTDCTVCPYQRLEEWHELWLNHPEDYQAGVEIEQRYKHTFRSAQRDTWPASLAELAKEFERGRPIRQRKTLKPCRVCTL